jgi:hypothetical protein
MGCGYRMQYKLNQLHLTETEDFIEISSGQGAMIRKSDYHGDAVEIVPSADPYIVSDYQRQQQNLTLLQMANQLPGFNRYQTQKRVLTGWRVSAIDQIMPPPMQQGQDPRTGQPTMVPAPDFPPPPPPPQTISAQASMLKAQTGAQKQQMDGLALKIQLLNEVQESRAKVQELQARASLEMAQSKSEVAEPFIKLIYAEIESEASRGERLLRMAEMISDARETANAASAGSNGKANGTGLAPMETQPTNADVLALTQGGAGANAGGLGGGSVPVQ